MPNNFIAEFYVWRVEYCKDRWRPITYAVRLNRTTRIYELKKVSRQDSPIIVDSVLDDFYIFEDVARAEAAQLNELDPEIRRCA